MVSDLDVDDVLFFIFSLIFEGICILEFNFKILFLRFLKFLIFLANTVIIDSEFKGDFKIKIFGVFVSFLRDLTKKLKFLGFE